MKNNLTLLIIILTGMLLQAQDLDLDVHLLPPAQLGNPAIFNIRVRNTGEEVSEGVVAQITMGTGLEYMSFNPSNFSFDAQSGSWTIGNLEKAQSKVLSIMARFQDREDAILQAEVSECLTPDADSSPGNGVDTNGNGIIVADKGDEDDGDAAEIKIPY